MTTLEIETAFQSDFERVLFTENGELRKRISALLLRVESRDQEIFLLKELVRKRALAAVSERVSMAPPSTW
jgi:hypothetical protein